MQHGLQSHYYELNDTYRHSVRSLSSVPKEALAIRKVSVLSSLNNTSTDLTSQFYSLDLLPVQLMMATFSGYLFFPSAGYYTFRSSFESEMDCVRPFSLLSRSTATPSSSSSTTTSSSTPGRSSPRSPRHWSPCSTSTSTRPASSPSLSASSRFVPRAVRSTYSGASLLPTSSPSSLPMHSSSRWDMPSPIPMLSPLRDSTSITRRSRWSMINSSRDSRVSVMRQSPSRRDSRSRKDYRWIRVTEPLEGIPQARRRH